MCVVCQLSMEAVVALGLSYQPSEQDLSALLTMNQRIEQLVVQRPQRLSQLDSAIQRLVSSSIKNNNDRLAYVAFTAQELLEYNRSLRDQ